MTTATEVAAKVEVSEPASVEFRKVCKYYGGLRAVDGITASAKAGQILGIVGPNGAGKTTLFDVITGLTSATSGSVMLAGKPVDNLAVHERCREGMARTFQRPTVAGDLSVRENVTVGDHFGRANEHWSGTDGVEGGFAEWCLRWAGLEEKASRNAGLLGVYDKKRLMLASAIAMGPRVLLLDEPFGGLNDEEIESMLRLIRSVADIGVTVICIEHVMRALVQLASSVVVMDQGKLVFEGRPSDMLADEKVIEIYLGRSQTTTEQTA